MERRVHEELTMAEPRGKFTYRSVIERVCDFCDVRVLRLRVQDDGTEGPFSYEAGQWVDFMIPGVETVGGYSFISSMISNCNEFVDNAIPPAFDLAVKRSCHPPAAWIHSPKCMENIEVYVRVGGKYSLGLLGQRHYYDIATESEPNCPTYTDEVFDREVVLIAGGVGINPLYAMLLELSAIRYISSAPSTTETSSIIPVEQVESQLLLPFSSPHVSCLLIWSVRSLDAAAFLLPQLERLAAVSRQLKVIITLTGENLLHEDVHADRWQRLQSSNITLRRGRVHAMLIGEHLQTTRSDTEREFVPSAFVCGPPIMATDVVAMLTSDELMFTAANVHAEKWW